MGGPNGILLVDKPGGITSHDVVARARRALDTRKIGHAGTLDPMATGLLILGVGSATRLLTYIVGLDKDYSATIRLGVSTDSDDADGEVTGRAEASAVAALSREQLDAAMAQLTGRISQVPSRVSAIKVNGRRAYDLVREGVEVDLAAREVTVSSFLLRAARPADEGCLDLDVAVACSSGTYVRAIARDLGAALGVGAHLTSLRRTRIGEFAVEDAVAVDAIGAEGLMAPAQAALRVLPEALADPDQARALRQGKRVADFGGAFSGPRAAAIAPDGALIGVIERRGAEVKSIMNMPEEPHP